MSVKRSHNRSDKEYSEDRSSLYAALIGGVAAVLSALIVSFYDRVTSFDKKLEIIQKDVTSTFKTDSTYNIKNSNMKHLRTPIYSSEAESDSGNKPPKALNNDSGSH